MTARVKRGFWLFLRFSIWGLGVMLAEGCHSTAPAAAKPPAGVVVIPGNTPGQIHLVTTQVFIEHGYHVAREELRNMEFEKVGTHMNDLAYGSWLNDTPVCVRVKVAIVSLGEEAYGLTCHAFLVRDIGGTTEEEIALGGMRSHQFQKLLEEVAARFRGGGTKAK